MQAVTMCAVSTIAMYKLISYILTLKQVRSAVMNSVGYVSRHLPRSEIEGIPSTLLTANTIPTARMVS